MMTGEDRRLSGGLSLSQTVFATLRVWLPGQAVEGHAALGWKRAMGERIQGHQERTRIAEGATWATSSKKFVELHRGKIWVESEVGKGSTYSFALPERS